MAGNVLHIAHVLVASLDLEGADAGVDQGFQVAALVIVLHRQQVLFIRHHAALAVGKRVRQAAGLRAVAAVGAAAGVGVGNVALAGKRHAQGAVDEILERGVGIDRLAHRADLLQAQFARQHQLGKTRRAEEARLLRGADVALRAGMQLDGRQVHFKQCHVLHDERIHAGLVQLPDLLARRLQFGIVQDGIERDEDAGAVAVREFHQAKQSLPASCWHCAARRRPGHRYRRRRRHAGWLRGRFRRSWRGRAVRDGGRGGTWQHPIKRRRVIIAKAWQALFINVRLFSALCNSHHPIVVSSHSDGYFPGCQSTMRLAINSQGNAMKKITLFVLGFAASLSAAHAADLHVAVEGMGMDKGKLYFALFDRDQFLQKPVAVASGGPEQAVATFRQPAARCVCRIRLPGYQRQRRIGQKSGRCAT